jgi:hypothetical protein
MESAYGVANNLATYLSAFQSGNIGSADNSIDNSTIADLGILGTAGFAVGGFLRSPFATDEASDIQITVYPTVSEPHILSLEARLRTALSSGGGCSGSESAAADPLPAVGYDSSDVLDEARHSDQDKPGKPKGGSSSSDTHSGTKKPTDVSKCPDTADYLGRRSPSDMLVTVQLLYPDAEMQVRLNSLDPVDGDPVIVPVTSNRTSSAFLSERDKARLAWGVQSARKILAASQLKAVLNAEISPGFRPSTETSCSGYVGVATILCMTAVSVGTVCHMIFPCVTRFQVETNAVGSSNYVGSAGMGRLSDLEFLALWEEGSSRGRFVVNHTSNL